MVQKFSRWPTFRWSKQIFWSKIFFISKQFLGPKMFCLNKICVQKIYGSNKILDLEKMLQFEKILWLKKNFETENFVGSEWKFCVWKVFLTETILSVKILWSNSSNFGCKYSRVWPGMGELRLINLPLPTFRIKKISKIPA